jgi:cephalosporin hydroxylase
VVTEIQYLLSAGPDDEPLPENPVIMVCLDSNHAHDHVLQELKLYSPMVTKGSYVVVFDTAVELTGENPKDRPWGPGNNPYTAVDAFMKGNEEFEIDTFPHVQALISEAPCGYLRRIR